MKHLLKAFLAVLLLAGTATAGDLDIDITTTSDELFKDFIEEAGRVTAYRSIAPAEPLGITGFDIGLGVSAVKISDKNWDGIIEDAWDYVPVPRIQVRKGLPLNVDIGGFYSQIPDSNIELWGGELQWALLEGTTATPALALRAHYTTLEGVDDLDLETYGGDVVVSKGFLFLTPYAGAGVVRIKGDYAGDDLVVDGALDDHEFTQPRYFAGVQGTLALLRFTAEAEYMERPTYSLKVSLGF
jgi:hypothetical protein